MSNIFIFLHGEGFLNKNFSLGEIVAFLAFFFPEPCLYILQGYDATPLLLLNLCTIHNTGVLVSPKEV
jgi:hypothetical protein